MKRIIMSMLCLVALPGLALADTSSDTELVRKAMNYYHQSETVVLVEHKFCSEIIRKGPNKNNCAEVIDPNTITQGSKVYLWMNFLVPGDHIKNTNVLLQFGRKGRVMRSQEMSFSQSIRYRTWKALPTKHLGETSIAIEQETATSFENIERLTYTVVKAENKEDVAK